MGNVKSFASSRFSKGNTTNLSAAIKQICNATMDVVAGASSSSIESGRMGTIQNFLLVWLDANIDESNEDVQNSLTQLRKIARTVERFTDVDECMAYMASIRDESIFLIVSETLCQTTIPIIHSMAKLDAIFIICKSEAQYEELAKKWPKIQSVCTTMTSICEKLKMAAHQCAHNTIPMSFVPTRKLTEVTADEQSLNELPPSFIYIMLFKEIILNTHEGDAKPLQDLVVYCNKKNISNEELKDFQCKYDQQSPIWWYTCENFLYGMLNYALRSLDMEAMVKTSFFIRSLHKQLEQLNEEQSETFPKQFIVYRGQELSQEAFQNLFEAKDGLLSFNNFLSTSAAKHVAMDFIERTLLKSSKDTVSVLFIMTVDSSKISVYKTPFALIEEYAAVKRENEILFSMHTIFRVNEIKRADNNNRFVEVQLTLTDDNDPQLANVMRCMREEIDGTGWYRMGNLMLMAGHYNEAEELYNELLRSAYSDNDRAYIYHELACVRDNRSKNKESVTSLEKSPKIKQETLPQEHSDLAPTYHNNSSLQNSMDDSSNALECYKRDLESMKKVLPPNHRDFAASYSKIGLACKKMGDYSSSLENYNKANKILEKSLPPTHHDLATSYSNIGGVYNNMGDYSKALEYYEKTHEIREKTFPSTHPSLAVSCSNLGRVYNNIGNYSKALEFYEKANKIAEFSLPPNHPNLATSYSNIGQVYSAMSDYSKALEYYEKSHKIYEKSLPSTYPELAGSYLSFAGCYERIGVYALALKALEKAYEIQQKVFQEGNPAFSVTHSWFGRVYRGMKDYLMALQHFEKCLAIAQKTLPERHPNMAITYSNIGDIHRLMGDYEKALSFQQKALDIQENVKCNPLDCATTYTNLGETYREMNDYTTALKYFEKGIEIRKSKLPKNHPDLAISYHSMAKLYLATRQYNMAVKNVQQAIELAQEKLPSNHPHLLDYKETFENIQKQTPLVF